MARQRKRQKRAYRGRAPIVVLAFVFLVVVLLVAYWYFYLRNEDGYRQNEQGTQGTQNEQGTVETGELSIHFLELGNKYAGDCTLIKIGNTEVLIDAGSRQSSATKIVTYLQTYCTDGVLEYVVATHADQDHIAAFSSTKSLKGVFDSFECKTIIDFPLTNKTGSKETKTLQYYYAARDAEVEAGAVHYTALQCWNQTDGALREYTLGENVTMKILYNYDYENKSSDENNYSVCLLVTQGDYHYLFTGDLEEEGEAYLVQNNALPQCKLFKGGHHGSRTSSTEALLSVIRPEIICICCCAGSPEYTKSDVGTFPTQDTLTRMLEYTDKIYVTSLATDVDLENQEWNYTSMNGDIVYTSDGIQYAVNGSNNSTILLETAWFREHRTAP